VIIKKADESPPNYKEQKINNDYAMNSKYIYSK
jgi:hypothetical protein